MIILFLKNTPVITPIPDKTSNPKPTVDNKPTFMTFEFLLTD